MSTIRANTILDSAGGNTATINGRSFITSSQTIAANNNDTTVPTSAAVKSYVDGVNVINLGTVVATTSGTAIDFTGIPSTARRVTIMLNGVSSAGTSPLIVQLGTGAGPTFQTSGYSGASTNPGGGGTSTFSSSFQLSNSLANTDVLIGTITLSNVTGNTWVETQMVSVGGSPYDGAGVVSLSGALTAVRISTVTGSFAFDAGSINISWE